MRLNSIRARTLLALAFICVAIVSILGGIWLYTTSQNIKSNVYTTDLSDSRLLASYVGMYLDSVENAAYTVSVDPDAATAVRTRNATGIKPDIDGMVYSTSQEDIAFLMDRNGRLIYSTGAAPSGTALSDYAHRYMNSTYITGIYYSNASRGHVFAIIYPIHENGSIIGYICDEVRPVDMDAFFKEHKTATIDHTILVDSRGTVVSRSNVSASEEHANLSSHTPVQKLLKGEEGVVEYISNGRRYISAYSPVSDTGWGVVVTTRADVAYQPLMDHALRILGICVIFIAALTILGYFASAYLISPIERLSGTMRRVSGGDYEVSIEARRNDEIGDLERAFNSLVEEVKQRDERIRTEKDRSEFYLDLMGHDINNMNHAGMGYLELARDNLRGRVDARDMALIEKAYEALKGSSALIDNVRRIQKVQASFLAPEELDLGRLLAEVKDKYGRYPGREVSINYVPSSCKVQTCGLFREVLSNIVENAIKHSDPSKPLTVNMALSGEKQEGKKYCRISIEDNGPGIPDEMKEAVFTRSHRGPTGARGKGLGLYIVKMLVEEYGGKVWAEDRVPGNHSMGARFVILMPVA